VTFQYPLGAPTAWASLLPRTLAKMPIIHFFALVAVRSPSAVRTPRLLNSALRGLYLSLMRLERQSILPITLARASVERLWNLLWVFLASATIRSRETFVVPIGRHI